MISKITKYTVVILLTVAYTANVFAQEKDSLNHYLKVAAENNPKVKADFLAYKASLEKIPQAAAYEDPVLEMGFYLEPMDIIGGRQVADFSLMQMFPWFGTRKAAKTEANHMAKMAFEQFRETRDLLYLEVYTQWYFLCRLQQQLVNNQENKKLLTQLEELAIKRFSAPTAGSSSSPIPAKVSSTSGTKTTASGMGSTMAGMSSGGGAQQPTGQESMTSKGSGASMSGMSSDMGGTSTGMSDVLRIQLEIVELDDNIESLESEIKSEKAKFNSLLNRPTDYVVHVPFEFTQTKFILDEATAMATIENQNPMLGMITEEGLAYKAKAEMDKKMSYPMFGIGVQYMLNKKTNDPMFAMGSMNGKDMIMPMVSVSIPIYRSKYKAQQRESKFWRQVSEEKHANTLNQLQSELYKTKHLLNDASRKIALYKKQENLAKTTYNLIIQEFVSGKSDLTNVIQVQRQLLDYQLKEAEAIANYNTMAASMQKLFSFEALQELN